jgi:hypothetical protein
LNAPLGESKKNRSQFELLYSPDVLSNAMLQQEINKIHTISDCKFDKVGHLFDKHFLTSMVTNTGRLITTFQDYTEKNGRHGLKVIIVEFSSMTKSSIC